MKQFTNEQIEALNTLLNTPIKSHCDSKNDTTFSTIATSGAVHDGLGVLVFQKRAIYEPDHEFSLISTYQINTVSTDAEISFSIEEARTLLAILLQSIV